MSLCLSPSDSLRHHDVNKQRVVVVQPTENKRTHQLSSSFCGQEMADRVDPSDFEIYWRLMWSVCITIETVASVQSSRLWTWHLKEIKVSWLPTVRWLSCDTLTLLRDPTKRASVLSLFSFSLLPVIFLPTVNTLLNVNNLPTVNTLLNVNNLPTVNTLLNVNNLTLLNVNNLPTVNTLLNVNNQLIEVRWSWRLVKLSIIIKCVHDDRTSFQKWLSSVIKCPEYRVLGPRLNLGEPRSEASFMKRLDH